jgi:hypothetical protein
MTNKEVAAVLVVTDRTIESALTQIYRELDVRSRTELARRLVGPARARRVLSSTVSAGLAAGPTVGGMATNRIPVTGRWITAGLLHPAALLLVASGFLVWACSVSGTITCGTSDDPTGTLFVASVATAAASGFAFGFGPLRRVRRREAHGGEASCVAVFAGLLFALIFGGLWFLVGGLVLLMIAFDHCPLVF